MDILVSPCNIIKTLDSVLEAAGEELKEPSNGVLVMTLDPVDSFSRRMRFVLWSGWIGMPVIFTAVLAMLYAFGDSTDLLLIEAVILYSICVLDFFLMDHVLGKYIQPVMVYSDGLQFPVSKVDKGIKRNQWVSKEEIELFRLSNAYRLDKVSSFDIVTRNGKKRQIGPRNEWQVRAALDYFGREWKVRVDTNPSWPRKG
jgi:hypothetical protein